MGATLIYGKYATQVWLLTPGSATDSYGDPSNDWEHPTETPLPGAEILIPATRSGARASAADDTATSTTVEGGAIFLWVGPAIPPMTDIGLDSRFLDTQGRVWRVAGNPNIKIGRHFQASHLTAPLHFLQKRAPRA